MQLETGRLLLRPLGVADLEEVVALHADPEVARFVGSLNRHDARERLRANESEWSELGYGRLAILDRVTGRFLGRAGLKYWPQFEETEVGWTLRRDAWGQGYATEAARASIEWGFASFEFPYITAMIEPANARSLSVAARLGMSRLRDDVLLERDVTVFAAQA